MKILKHVFSFILPITVLIIIPYFILEQRQIRFSILSIIGIILILVGLFLLIWIIKLFTQTGKGTLAPWSPTKNMVTTGVYGYVRNPMILAVCITLIGESLLFKSINIGMEAVVFFLVNTIYFTKVEEPGLVKRFGDEYREYKKNVPRWIPRKSKWKPESTSKL